MTATTIPARSEVAPEFTWNAESVYPDKAAWEADLERVNGLVTGFARYTGRLGEGPAVLVEALQARDELDYSVMKPFVYADLTLAVDTTNGESLAMKGKALAVFARALAALAFLEPELLTVGRDTLQGWIATEPRLKIYAHYFENLYRKAAHVRSAEVEELLGLLADPFSGVDATRSMLVDADFKYPPVTLPDGTQLPLNESVVLRLLDEHDRDARRKAWENYHGQFMDYKNTLTSSLTTSVKQNVFQMRARRYPSTLEMALFENNIPVEVFHNLIETFQRRLPIWHRYFELRRRALGVEALRPYDVWAPLTRAKTVIPYEQAVAWICDGLAPLGAEYVERVRRGCLEERWVDVFPNRGKSSGAFSYGTQGMHPFIVLSYNGNLFNFSTLAHELGHSMHSYLAWKEQPKIYSEYSLFAAEVASNFHQALVRAHLLEREADPVFQIQVIEEAMSNFHRYFLTMPTLARFELEMHQRVERGETPTADQLNARFAELLQESYGPAVQVDPAVDGVIWATYGHLYADYYVYQYATGIAAANALSRRIKSGAPGAVEAYLGFLRAGSSVYPLDGLRTAGVDLTTPQPVEEAFQVLEGYVDRLEKLL